MNREKYISLLRLILSECEHTKAIRKGIADFKTEFEYKKIVLNIPLETIEQMKNDLEELLNE